MEKRLFIAVKYTPDENFLRSFMSIKTQINSWASVKWVEVHQLHLTLCFLGNTSVVLVKSIEKVLNEVCLQNAMFDAQIIQLNTFSHQRQPRVLWLGLQPAEKFRQLHIQLTQGLESEFYRLKDSVVVPQIEVDYSFLPHLTLGRFRTVFNPQKINGYISNHKHNVFGIWKISQIVLYESVLSHAGPHYSVLTTAHLQ